MSSSAEAQLSSLAATIDELVDRTATMADELDLAATADAANALYEAERSLQVARRAVDRARNVLGG